MTKEEIRDNFNNTAKELSNMYFGDSTQYFISVYTRMFGAYPNIINIVNEGRYLNKDVNERIFSDYSYVDDEPEIDYGFEFNNIAMNKTFIKLCEKFKDSAYIIRQDKYPLIVGENFMVYFNDIFGIFYVFQNSPILREDIKECIVDDRIPDNVRIVSYVARDNMGFMTTKMQVTDQHSNLEELYNDDLPHEAIKNFINGNTSGLILLHGECGTGKTSYIRHLMYEFKNKEFMVLDSSVFNYITDASFIQLLTNKKNAVVLLEDCESMLVDRTEGNNRLSALLNLSDGILGDSFKFKFICTFNTSVSKLDSAILRKGRLKMKYEFKPLELSKAKKLLEKLGKPTENVKKALTLAEIFNYGEDNGVINKKKTIGFGQED